jgi:hypothetical protein
MIRKMAVRTRSWVQYSVNDAESQELTGSEGGWLGNLSCGIGLDVGFLNSLVE